MASGRSARLPPTPTANVRHVEVNQNNMYANRNGVADETINVLGPQLAAATSQVLDSLSEREKQMIMDVLSRDEGIRKRDAARIMYVYLLFFLLSS